eukprot:364288-Chlamydomonas_euryale.AAC.7
MRCSPSCKPVRCCLSADVLGCDDRGDLKNFGLELESLHLPSPPSPSAGREVWMLKCEGAKTLSPSSYTVPLTPPFPPTAPSLPSQGLPGGQDAELGAAAGGAPVGPSCT